MCVCVGEREWDGTFEARKEKRNTNKRICKQKLTNAILQEGVKAVLLCVCVCVDLFVNE